MISHGVTGRFQRSSTQPPTSRWSSRKAGLVMLISRFCLVATTSSFPWGRSVGGGHGWLTALPSTTQIGRSLAHSSTDVSTSTTTFHRAGSRWRDQRKLLDYFVFEHESTVFCWSTAPPYSVFILSLQFFCRQLHIRSPGSLILFLLFRILSPMEQSTTVTHASISSHFSLCNPCSRLLSFHNLSRTSSLVRLVAIMRLNLPILFCWLISRVWW